MERAPLLVCVEGSLVGRQFTITTDGLRLGREAVNEVVIVDNGVSRQHARVLVHNGAVWVQDAGSRNGVFVNDKRVPDHKQLKMGDRLRVGDTLFEVATSAPSSAPVQAAPPPSPRPAAPAPSVAPDVRAAAAPSPSRWKVWPFVVAVAVVVVLVLLVALAGGDSATSQGTPPPVASAYSLASVVDASGTAAVAAAPVEPSAPSVQDALAAAAGLDAASARAKLPEPPAGATAEDLRQKAQGMMDAGRLADARIHYQMALKLDPACNLCQVRIEKLAAEINKQAQEQLDAGMRALDSMQYAQAVSALQRVLLLVPDTADPMNVRAAEALRRAQAGGGAAAPR